MAQNLSSAGLFNTGWHERIIVQPPGCNLHMVYCACTVQQPKVLWLTKPVRQLLRFKTIPQQWVPLLCQLACQQNANPLHHLRLVERALPCKKKNKLSCFLLAMQLPVLQKNTHESQQMLRGNCSFLLSQIKSSGAPNRKDANYAKALWSFRPNESREETEKRRSAYPLPLPCTPYT